jgi:sugar-specific transcriptional regulator TrmB
LRHSSKVKVVVKEAKGTEIKVKAKDRVSKVNNKEVRVIPSKVNNKEVVKEAKVAEIKAKARDSKVKVVKVVNNKVKVNSKEDKEAIKGPTKVRSGQVNINGWNRGFRG